MNQASQEVECKPDDLCDNQKLKVRPQESPSQVPWISFGACSGLIKKSRSASTLSEVSTKSRGTSCRSLRPRPVPVDLPFGVCGAKTLSHNFLEVPGIASRSQGGASLQETHIMSWQVTLHESLLRYVHEPPAIASISCAVSSRGAGECDAFAMPSP